MDLERIYAYLPVPLQNLAVSLEGWRVNRRRYDGSYSRLQSAVDARARLSEADMTALRVRRLRSFLQHASQNVPHYRDLFRRLGLDVGQFRGLEDLGLLPILTKQEVQDSPERFAAEGVPSANCIVSHTSGTTGGGLRFPVTREAHREQWAVWWRYRGWHGITRDTPCCYFGGRAVVPISQRRPPYWRHNRAGCQLLFSGYHLSQETASLYLDEIERSQAPWIHGYPSLISLLGFFALQHGHKLSHVRFITTGAESLLPQQATLIEQAFGTKPIEHYGMAEGVANISMCPLRRLHVDEDFAAVEFIPNSTSGYKTVGTNFTNMAMPLIRYEVGDIADIDQLEARCSCGRPGRIVRAIDGRKEDLILTKSGAWLGRLDHIFKDQVHIREAQIRQETAGHVNILVVKGPGYSEVCEQGLRSEIIKFVGSDIDFDIRYVESLERTPSGKLRFVVSSIRAGELATSA